MRLCLVLVAAILTSAPALAQNAKPSPQGETRSSGQDASETSLPVSLDRIREGLARPTPGKTLTSLEKVPDFRVAIDERQRFEEMLETLRVAPAPVPPGGLYAYEQQQNLWNEVDRPLMQPYAAFSGREVAIIAAQNLIAHYLLKNAIEAFRDARTASAARAARLEVARAIASYCSMQQPAGRADIQICRIP